MQADPRSKQSHSDLFKARIVSRLEVSLSSIPSKNCLSLTGDEGDPPFVLGLGSGLLHD